MKEPGVAAVLLTVVLSVPAGGLVYGQDENEGEQVVVGLELFERLLTNGGVVRLFPAWSREGQTQSPSTRVATVVNPEGGELVFHGLSVNAESYSLDLESGVVEAEGSVTVTTTREDGATVTMRAERMTMGEEQ